MDRVLCVVALVFSCVCLAAQAPSAPLDFHPGRFSFTTPFEPAEGGSGGGGGQVEPTAYADRYLTKFSFGGSVSLLGTGGEVATNLPYRIDLRAIGNFTDFDWKTNHSGFYVVVNIGMANTGVFGDYYPWKSLRISPGFLYYNTNRIRGDINAGPGATFTINNVNYSSLDSNPVHGVGRLTLGGNGFMVTTGWGHYISRKEKHWSFPFEGGVVFIDKPNVFFNLAGTVCSASGHSCAPAASFPGLTANINAQIVTWKNDVAPFHIYPVIEGGATYTFRYRR